MNHKRYPPQMFHHIQYVTEEGRIHLYTTILRDTETYQSLALAFLDQSDTRTTVLLQGVELGTMSVPLPKIFLICNWICCNWSAIHEGNYCPRKQSGWRKSNTES